jgi:hypothetical protein
MNTARVAGVIVGLVPWALLPIAAATGSHAAGYAWGLLSAAFAVWSLVTGFRAWRTKAIEVIDTQGHRRFGFIRRPPSDFVVIVALMQFAMWALLLLASRSAQGFR